MGGSKSGILVIITFLTVGQIPITERTFQVARII